MTAMHLLLPLAALLYWQHFKNDARPQTASMRLSAAMHWLLFSLPSDLQTWQVGRQLSMPNAMCDILCRWHSVDMTWSAVFGTFLLLDNHPKHRTSQAFYGCCATCSCVLFLSDSWRILWCCHRASVTLNLRFAIIYYHNGADPMRNNCDTVLELH